MGPSPQHEVEQWRGPGHGHGWRVQTRGGDGERPRRWRLRGSVGAEARQCPLKLCQSGLDDAERDRAATVDVAVEGTQASRASILPTSVWESEEDDRHMQRFTPQVENHLDCWGGRTSKSEDPPGWTPKPL